MGDCGIITNKGVNMKPNKECMNCDVSSNYICFETEDMFMKEHYPNYFYNDDCEWELKQEVK